MTIGQRFFYLLDEKGMTQAEFSRRTGIATTTISDWRKKNTNPGSDKVMLICSALDVTPEYLLSGVQEDSERGRGADYMVIPKGTEERELLDRFDRLDWLERKHLLEYAERLAGKNRHTAYESNKKKSMKKIAEFCDIEIFMDEEFSGEPKVDVNYLDDDVSGSIRLSDGEIFGNFSKYVLPVIDAWVKEHREMLLQMWRDHSLQMIPAWE